MMISDTHGNNLLHLLVLHNLPDMYAFVKSLFKQSFPHLSAPSTDPNNPLVTPWTSRNSDGFTPLTLAANIGSMDMFSFLLEEQKQTQWTYGPVSCFLYPLAELDLYIKKEGESESVQCGALELIVNSAHTELLMHPRMIDLVKQKWYYEHA